MGLLAAAPQASAAGRPAPNPAEMARVQSDLPVGIRIALTRPLKNLTGAYRGVAQEGKEEKVVVFFDLDGRPLYAPASGACNEACLKNWRPATAPRGAAAKGGFTIVGGNWVFNGKPVYVAVNGPKLGDPYPFEPGDQLLKQHYLMGLAVQEDVEGMRLVRLVPTNWIATPYSIGVGEYRLAPGQILAAGAGALNPMGQALYAFTGTPAQEAALPLMFKPAEAAVLSLAIGDFTVHERDDGIRQWVYKGAKLFSCTCDFTIGAVNGAGAAPGIGPAFVYSYSVPNEVTFKRDNLAVGRLMEASTGKTLYFRDRMSDDYQPDGSRNMYGNTNGPVSAALGLKHCDAECERDWKPLLAPKDAQPTGYWAIYDRPDGKRQWSYKDAALYTYAKEGPGRLDGNETYKIEFEDGHGGKAMPTEFGIGLNWRALVP